nr:DNA translocase FtsK [Sphaerochaetaceae bacterium]
KIAFAVANSSNSRIILDENGAEKLLGRGDMLYASPSSGTQQRIQGAYIDSEVEDIVDFVKEQEKPDYVDEAYFEDEEEEEEENPNGTLSSQDSGEDLFSRAWHLVAEKGEASASYLQRRLNIGYNRAANLIEQLEDAGYIGPAKGGSKPRDVLKYPDSQK